MNYDRSNPNPMPPRQTCAAFWAAALTPFRPDLSIRRGRISPETLRHWVDDLGRRRRFVCGKQGEFFSMSRAERKRTLEIAVEEIGGARTILSCSDQNLDTVIALARHARRSAPITS